MHNGQLTMDNLKKNLCPFKCSSHKMNPMQMKVVDKLLAK